jgi:hypothetical protein
MKTDRAEPNRETYFDYFAEIGFIEETPALQHDAEPPDELNRAWSNAAPPIERELQFVDQE